MTITNSFEDLAGGSLDSFKPKPPTAKAAAPTTRKLEQVAESEGFTVNNRPVVRRVLKAGRVASKEKAQPMTLRIRVADWNRFSAYCERHGYTVAEGFEKLTALADGQ